MPGRSELSSRWNTTVPFPPVSPLGLPLPLGRWRQGWANPDLNSAWVALAVCRALGSTGCGLSSYFLSLTTGCHSVPSTALVPTPAGWAVGLLKEHPAEGLGGQPGGSPLQICDQLRVSKSQPLHPQAEAVR